MSVTITVHEPLAAQLKSEAQQRRVSLADLAADLLARALEGARDSKWYEANRRRLALLQKSAKTGLTAREAEELKELQTLADQRLEAMDAGRLAEVERIEREVKAALQEAEGS
jgi:hypothetical protein